MASRPSDPLLAFLRDAVRKKGLNTAELATRTGIERSKLKQRLAGVDDLTVDDLIALSKALELTPAELGLAGVEGADVPIEVPEVVPAPPVPGPDPFGNLPRQVVELGFALGVDLFFVLDTAQLVGSGIPRAVLEEQREQLRLRMEARWFPQNKARFLEDAMVCKLSFDALYECTIPWSAFRTVTFLLPVEAPAPPSTEPAGPTRPAAPFLRVVK
ncbi:MAG: helix-turn-helix transcriptional regulator [Pseudomonadota bacterium]|nr:helix-turn-helix transcriptional regulator [Pseudomonadota bacterium]